ncbi:MAG: NUDIX hydrolase [Muribaculaceae bacterium]|nr:NUDIX hydrolase [Muribaculaceae bacterium]
MSYTYEYPQPALTADCVIYGFDGEHLKILLVERGLEPYKGMWALPGGFMQINETIDQAAARELREETGLKDVYMTQFRMFSEPDRDVRKGRVDPDSGKDYDSYRVVTMAFIALVRPSEYELVAGDDAVNALWFEARHLPPLAFDHGRIIDEANEYLKEQLRLKPIFSKLLNKNFSMGELQRLFEDINDTTYDRRNFQRKALKSTMVGEVQDDASLEADSDCPVLHEEDCIICCESEADYVPHRESPLRTSRPGRKPNRMFTFLNKLVSKDRADDSDSSIRDIFNY